jgi:hypothetical protein
MILLGSVSSDDQITLLMRRQWGLVSRQQLLAMGVSTNTIRRRLKHRHWQHAASGVYRLSGSTHADSWEERLMAACLQGAPHTVASHRSAACLWRLDDFFHRKPEPLQVTIPKGKELVVAKLEVRFTRAPVSKPATKHGIPCTPLPRTLIDLCMMVPLKQVEIALDSALRQRPSWRKWIGSETEKLPRKHPSRAVLLGLLNERDFTFDSKPELDLKDLLWSSGLRDAQVHFTIHDEITGQRLGNVDFCWPRLKLLIQFHGLGVHLRADRFRIDQRQVSQLAARGWTPIITTKDEIQRDPVGFIRNLQRAHELCCAREGLAPNLLKAGTIG